MSMSATWIKKSMLNRSCMTHSIFASKSTRLQSLVISLYTSYRTFKISFEILLLWQSFSRTQKARLRGYQNQLVDLLGPAPPPPPRCNPHHHRAQTRRSSSHLHGMAGGRGGCGAGSSHSAPFLPRGSFCGGGCGAWGSASAGRGRFVTPLRATFNQNRSTGVLLHPPLHPNWHGGGGILRGRSAEPDVYNNIQQRRHTPPPPHHHHAQASSSRFASAFQDQAALWSASQQHPRVASMDCLAPSTPPLSPSDQQLHMVSCLKQKWKTLDRHQRMLIHIDSLGPSSNMCRCSVHLSGLKPTPSTSLLMLWINGFVRPFSDRPQNLHS